MKEQKKNNFEYLSPKTVQKYLPMMIDQNVSIVARRRGFTKKYLNGFNPFEAKASRNTNWNTKRRNYIKRRIARPFKLYNSDGTPTRYHLSLISWAYSPDRKLYSEF